jgi:hypothetical protein
LNNSRLVEIEKHFAADKTLEVIEVIDRILGKNGRLRQPQFVGSKELICHVAECTDSFVALVG